MSIKKISHIGVAVSDLEAQLAHYRDALGLEFLGIEEVPDQGVRVAMLRVGEAQIELLQPLSEESPVARFIAKRGQGIHHLAFEVEGLEGMLAGLAGAGVRLIDAAPRAGAHGKRIAFLHPGSTFGVLTELCE